ncbi:hypothetical protein H6G41_08310 [Tolypothrix sp. FACHB-123]|uniref:hypothetical protein n=1 Tax=Tolypothrix sp. FACHB-123 TaxID=2692868 RepID=UPI0016874AA8|nr:hypothetical protein [Tolypothrix sp. FACHB-123]MBD2354632.1 hypothetical protein [Tolypothrix sp. FACHB-123]
MVYVLKLTDKIIAREGRLRILFGERRCSKDYYQQLSFKNIWLKLQLSVARVCQAKISQDQPLCVCGVNILQTVPKVDTGNSLSDEIADGEQHQRIWQQIAVSQL